MDDADGLGALVGSVSVLSGLLGLAVFMFDVVGQLSVVVPEAGVAGFVESTRVATDDVVFVEVVVVVVLVCVTGAGDGELLCNCGDELFEPRSTDDPPRFELRKTRCCFCSSLFNEGAPVFLSSTLFVESDGLVQRDDALSLSAESLLFDDDATTYGNAALFLVEIFLPFRVLISWSGFDVCCGITILSGGTFGPAALNESDPLSSISTSLSVLVDVGFGLAHGLFRSSVDTFLLVKFELLVAVPWNFEFFS